MKGNAGSGSPSLPRTEIWRSSTESPEPRARIWRKTWDSGLCRAEIRCSTADVPRCHAKIWHSTVAVPRSRAEIRRSSCSGLQCHAGIWRTITETPTCRAEILRDDWSPASPRTGKPHAASQGQGIGEFWRRLGRERGHSLLGFAAWISKTDTPVCRSASHARAVGSTDRSVHRTFPTARTSLSVLASLVCTAFIPPTVSGIPLSQSHLLPASHVRLPHSAFSSGQRGDCCWRKVTAWVSSEVITAQKNSRCRGVSFCAIRQKSL